MWRGLEEEEAQSHCRNNRHNPNSQLSLGWVWDVPGCSWQVVVTKAGGGSGQSPTRDEGKKIQHFIRAVGDIVWSVLYRCSLHVRIWRTDCKMNSGQAIQIFFPVADLLGARTWPTGWIGRNLVSIQAVDRARCMYVITRRCMWCFCPTTLIACSRTAKSWICNKACKQRWTRLPWRIRILSKRIHCNFSFNAEIAIGSLQSGERQKVGRQRQ